MTFPLAHKRGFLKEEGIDAEIIRITGKLPVGVNNGEVDYGTGMADRRRDYRKTHQSGGLLRARSCSRTRCAARDQISPGA